MPNNKGITLATSVILIVFASIAVLSVTTFIVQRFSLIETRRVQTRTLYLAQAGIQNAIYSYRSTGYFRLGPTNVDPSNYFVIGGNHGDFLKVDTSSADLITNPLRLQGVSIQNATNSNDIVIDRMVVNWPPNGRKLKEIWINGVRVFRSGGGVAPPANANISNFTLNTTPTNYPLNYLLFNGSMAGVAYIDAQFVMTGGSSKTVRLYPAANNFRFTVKAMGENTGTSLYRTIQAEYNANTGNIVDYHEINQRLP